MKRLLPHFLEPAATNGHVLTTVAGETAWAAAAGAALTVQDENTNVSTAVTQIDFQGSGVTTTAGTGEVIVTIPGSSGTPVFHGCKASRITNQAITNNTITTVQFNDTDSYDTDALHDPSTNNTRITVPASGFTNGVWRLTATVLVEGGTTGLRSVSFSLNGVEQTAGMQRTNALSSSTASNRLTTTADIAATSSDYFEVNVYQNQGASLNLTGARFSAQYLGAL